MSREFMRNVRKSRNSSENRAKSVEDRGPPYNNHDMDIINATKGARPKGTFAKNATQFAHEEYERTTKK